MSIKWLILAARVLIAVVLGIYLLRFTGGASLLLPLVGVFYGLIIFLLFGFPFIRRIGEKVSQLYEPADENFPIVPQSSVAEARVKEGKYQEAVVEYRKVIAEHPADVYAHVRIADIAVEHLHDLKLAETELLAAQAKAVQEDAAVLIAHRLADLYQHQLNNPQRGLDVLLSVRGRLTSVKRLKLIEERIAFLRQLVEGHEIPQPPKSIQLRKSRYRMHD
ncbi:MAG: hypothetical protein ABSC38_07200 [Verrucomicrobiia bacterium]